MAFRALQALGVHVTPNHFYAPIPDTRYIDPALFRAPSELGGVDLRGDAQRALLTELAAGYQAEYSRLPVTVEEAGEDGYYLANQFFSSVDAEVLYAMIRHLKPRRIIEVGSGFSTMLMLRALAANAVQGSASRVTCIEPYPRDSLAKLAAQGRIELLRQPVERLSPDVVDELQAGDILFIDSSHVLRTGGDVQHEFNVLLPRLPPGVYVHVHDVFLPYEYPREWVLERRWFWNEQYLLQAFLAFNSAFEVVLALAWFHHRHPETLARLVPSYDPAKVLPGSFWMRRSATG